MSFEVALSCAAIDSDTVKSSVLTANATLLSLRESWALRPGEGPPRPLPRPTLPQAGR